MRWAESPIDDLFVVANDTNPMIADFADDGVRFAIGPQRMRSAGFVILAVDGKPGLLADNKLERRLIYQHANRKS